MSTRINTNVDAFGAQRNMALNAMNYSKSVEKLSSGLRINRAGDGLGGPGRCCGRQLGCSALEPERDQRHGQPLVPVLGLLDDWCVDADGLLDGCCADAHRYDDRQHNGDQRSAELLVVGGVDDALGLQWLDDGCQPGL